MIITQLVLFGCVALGGRLYRQRVMRRAEDDPEASGPEAPDPEAPAVDEELSLLDRDLALSATGLASFGAGVLLRPALGILAVPCVAAALVPMVRRGWADCREKRRLSYHGFEAVAATVTLAGGHVVVCALGLTAFTAGRRLLLTTQRSTRRDLLDRLGATAPPRMASFEQGRRHETEEMADATIAPTMLAGGMGLVARGVTGGIAGLWANAMEVAWLGAPVALLSLTRAAAAHDLLIRDGRSVEALAEVDTVAFGPRMQPPPSVVHALRRRGHRVLVLDAEVEEARARAALLGADGWYASADPEALAVSVAALGEAGRTVCVIARDGHAGPAMGAARVSVAAPVEPGDLHAEAQIVLLGGRPGGVIALFELADRHGTNRDRMFALAAVPSVLAVGAVLFAGVGPAAVIGAHAGTLAVGLGLGLRERGWAPAATPTPMTELAPA